MCEVSEAKEATAVHVSGGRRVRGRERERERDEEERGKREGKEGRERSRGVASSRREGAEPFGLNGHQNACA